ncbi:MAG: cation transporter, partial [Gammaproteobacteria bacterium]|nr:cation transporter [Gammaproteobacteria bacterium]
MTDNTTQTELSINGMTCASCVMRVEKALLKVPGVVTASVNLASEQAYVKTTDAHVDTSALIAAIKKAGYDATELKKNRDEQRQHKDHEQFELKKSLMVSAILTLPIFVLEMGTHLIPAFHHWLMATLPQTSNWIIQFVLSSVVLFGPGRRFLSSGIPALFRFTPDMNSLVAMGTLSAWGFSVVATFAGNLLP